MLSKQTAEKLDLLRVGPNIIISSIQIQEQLSIDAIIQQHTELFKGTGKLKVKLQLHINSNIQPVQQPIRRIPFHTREKSGQSTHTTIRTRHN